MVLLLTRLVLSIAILVAVFFFISVEELLAAFSKLELWSCLLSFACLSLSLLMASMRFFQVSQNFNIHLPFLAAYRINIYSIIWSLFFVSYLTQTLGRVAHSNAYTNQKHLFVTITLFEKVMSIFVLLCIALLGAVVIVGAIEIINIDYINYIKYIFFLAFSILLCLFIGYKFVLTSATKTAINKAISTTLNANVLLPLLLTIGAHTFMLLAYYFIGSTIFPTTDKILLLAACAVVMMAASFPINIAGWGVRELSAAVVFVHLGLSAESAVAMTTTLGLLFLCALGVQALWATWFTHAPRHINHDVSDKPAFLATKEGLPGCAAVLLGVLIVFLVRLPTPTLALNVNLADPIALLVGLTFFMRWFFSKDRQPLWQQSGFGVSLLLLVLMLGLGWIVGHLYFGSNSWALYNRIIGAIILFCYLMAGVYIGRNSTASQVQEYVRLLAVVLLLSMCLQYIFTPLLPQPIAEYLVWSLNDNTKGFLFNRNAYAIFLVLVFCFMSHDIYKRKFSDLFIISALILSCFISGSRSGMGALVVVSIYYIIMDKRNVRMLMYCCTPTLIYVLGTHILTTLIFVDAEPVRLLGGQFMENRTNIVSITNADNRIPHMLDAFRMWLDHPIFGIGLGGFIEYDKTIFVIHNTALWVLTEMGIVGLLLCLPTIFFTLKHIFKQGYRNMSAERSIMLAFLMVIVLFSTMHDMSYQRIIWYLLGMLMCCKVLSAKDFTAPENVKSANKSNPP